MPFQRRARNKGCGACAGKNAPRLLRARIWLPAPGTPQKFDASYYRNLPFGYSPQGRGYRTGAQVISASILTGCLAQPDSTGIDVANSDWQCLTVIDPGGAGNQVDNGCLISNQGGWSCRQNVAGQQRAIQPDAGSFLTTAHRTVAVWSGAPFTVPLAASAMEVEWNVFDAGSGSDTGDTVAAGVALFVQNALPNTYGFYACGITSDATQYDDMKVFEQLPSGITPLTTLQTAALPTVVRNNPDTIKFQAINNGATMILRGFWNNALVCNTVSGNVHAAGKVGLATLFTPGFTGAARPFMGQDSVSITVTP